MYKLAIWILIDNYYDALRPGNEVAKRTCGQIQTEQGLFYFVEPVLNGKTSTCMFDYRYLPSGIINNMKNLGLDIGKVSTFSLRHATMLVY